MSGVVNKETAQAQQPFDVAWQTIDGLNVRYATGGRGGESVILLSPWPESILAFAPVWEGLTKRFDVLAIDLPGFGQSEGRDDLFAPQKMGEFIVKQSKRSASRRYTPSDSTSERLRLCSPRWRGRTSAEASSWGAGAATYPLAVEGNLKSMIKAQVLRPLNADEVIERFLGSIRGYAVPRFVRDYRILRGRSVDAVCGARSRVPERLGCTGAAACVDHSARRNRCRSERPLRARS